MAGLWQKDFCLLAQRKQSLVLFLAISVMLGFTTDGTFIISYLPMLMLMLAVSTISYDEMEGGFTFLFTLPINAKIYVTEKYLLCLAGAGVSWLMASGLYFGVKLYRGNPILLGEELPMLLFFIPVFVLFVAGVIPLQLKFGAEKSRIVLLMGVGVLLLAGYGVGKVTQGQLSATAFSLLDSLSPVALLGAAFCAAGAALAVSYPVSIRIINGKEL